MDQFEKIKKIGKGNYGQILLVKDKTNEKLFALKHLSQNPESSPNSSISPFNEIKVLESLNHPNIIKYYDSFLWKNKYCILMEYAENGDLQQRVKQARLSKCFIEENTIMDWIAQLSLAIKYLHDLKILHRDIKLQNIFLNNDGIIKLGDFGISKQLDFTGEFAKTALGTPYYLSPEICSNSTYNHMTDIWMLGCVIYELFTLEKPFVGDSFPAIIYKILNEDPIPLPETVNPFIRGLVKRIFSKTPHLRPDINEILEFKEIKEKCFQYINMHIFKALLEPSQTSNEISQLEEEKAESSPQKDSKPSLLQCHSLPLSNPHQKLEKTSQNSHNSIHSIIQARKISIPPTNNLFQSSLSNATTPNSLHNLPDYNHLMTLKPPNIESTYKKPLKPSDTEVLDNITVKKPSQKYQRKISINVLESNYTKKTPPLSKESLNKNNIPTEKVQTKTFNFVNTIFNPTNSPNRTILFSEYLVERLGEARFNRMKSYLETHSNPLKVLEEERGMIGEVIGEENLDCIKIFKYLISNVVTPSKGETMIKMKEESRSRGEMFKKKVKEEG